MSELLYVQRTRLCVLTLICLFMVMQNNVMKYMTRMGQKTGMLKKSKKVQVKAISVAFVAEYQNLNSGRRRMKGRNSSLCRVGSDKPSSRRKQHEIKIKSIRKCSLSHSLHACLSEKENSYLGVF